MPRIALVAIKYHPLEKLLLTHGVEVERFWIEQHELSFDNYLDAVLIDLKKDFKAYGVPSDMERHLAHLPLFSGSAVTLANRLLEYQPDAIVVTCTYDAFGCLAVYLAKRMGIPSIHVQHNCQSTTAEDAWYCAEYPGDYVLVPGERDKQWWGRVFESHPEMRAKNPTVRIAASGHYDWDAYATMTRRVRSVEEKPVVCWIAESGANPLQTAPIWQSREMPDVAFAAFAKAMQTPGLRDARILVKARFQEERALVDRWVTTLDDAGLDVAWCDTPMPNVLPTVDLTVSQQSNAGVESLLAGVPTVSLRRPGVELLEEVPSLDIAADGLADSLAEKIAEGLYGSEWTEARCKTLGQFYANNLDGKAGERIARAVATIASGERTSERVRELVTA